MAHRITITLPDDLTEKMDYVAASLGFTRSSLIAYFSRGPVELAYNELGGLNLPIDEGKRRRISIKTIEELDNFMEGLGAQPAIKTDDQGRIVL